MSASIPMRDYALHPAIATVLDGDSAALAQARRMLEFIMLSRQTFPMLRELADHPGWEIMLHVYIAGCEGRPLSAVGIGELTDCWRPLAIRYVQMLIERGLFMTETGSHNAEHAPLRLTPDAQARFEDLLCRFARNWRPEA